MIWLSHDLPEELPEFPDDGGLAGAGPGAGIATSSTRHITTMPNSMFWNFILSCTVKHLYVLKKKLQTQNRKKFIFLLFFYLVLRKIQPNLA